ncbi:hypothetical protein GPECTOR_66g235 [Gonium pectorale]|uniref:COR domain-containing protein n=1 Tax=Gonium pectorale TaxID=33097 RepID=A0A150G3S8_GONPE|nr:hypothetical protein GPECTOR_66g235 [Gonium pectorale]|eukprot:KXZ44507.1 hypothetical protein GPECTOR_66g235 [Gonium pectorale]
MCFAFPSSTPSFPTGLQGGWNPLHVACGQGHLEVVRALLAAGASTGAALPSGATPLYIACEHGHAEVVEELIGAGADVHAAMTAGGSPLHVACGQGHLEVVRALLAAGASTGAALPSGATPLHIACEYDHVEVVEELIGAGADVHAAMTNGATPLHFACQNGYVEVVEALIGAGADVHAAVTSGATPLHIACEYGHMEAVEELIRAGADVHAAMTGGWSPLHVACGQGHLEVVRALLAAGASTGAALPGGATPLYIACEYGHVEVVEELIGAGADVHAPVTDGWNPFRAAAYGGHVGVMRALLVAEEDEATESSEGRWTPLHLACLDGDLARVEQLLQQGAPVDAASKDGKTPLDLARAEGFDGLADLLLQHASDMATSIRHGFWSTHAIFMSPEAVYITVYNSRDHGQAASVDAYIERVQTLAPGARTMVVGAWADEGFTGVQPPATAMCGYKNPVGILGLQEGECLCLSSKTENGIPELKQAIMELTGVIQSASMMDVVRLPALYMRLRDKVRSLRHQLKEDKLKLVSLKDIIGSMETAVPQEPDLHRLLNKLSDFGELLRFQHIPGLEDKVVIDPEWLADVLGDVVTRDKDKQQRLQLAEGHVSMRRVNEVMEARCPGHSKGLVRILEEYGLLYDLGNGEQAIVPPMLQTLEADDIERFLRERPKAGPLRVVACGPEPELLGLLVSSQLTQVREQFPGVKLTNVKYDCPECLGSKGSEDTRASPREVTATAVWKQVLAKKCDECEEDSDMSVYALDEQAVNWYHWYPLNVGHQGGKPRGMLESQDESEGTLKLHRSLGAMERVVERVKDLPDSTALVVELRKSLVRRAVALHKLVGPSEGERLPLAVLLSAPDNVTSNHRMELDLDSTTSGLPGSVRLHALCEYPGGLHLTDHGGYEVTEARAWLRKHGRGMRPLLRALQLAGVSGPVGTLGAGDPEVEVKGGREEMQRTHSRGRSVGRVTGWGEVGPTQQLDSMLACLDRLVELQDGLHQTAVVSPAAEGKENIEGRPADLYSACQEACTSIAKIVQPGNAEAGGHQEAGERPAAGGMPRLQRVVTRTAGAMWLCARHAEVLGCVPLRSL